MEKVFKNLKNLLIVVLVIIIVLLRNCRGKIQPTPTPKITVKTEIVYDTIKDSIINYVPYLVEKTLPPEIIYKDVDTAAILKDYFTSYYYSDTIINDSLKIIINDTVYKNSISSRSVKYDILYPIKTITIKEEHFLNQREFYIGPRVGMIYGGDNVGLSFVGIEGLFRSKKRTTVAVAAGVNQAFGVNLQVGLHWKLGKK